MIEEIQLPPPPQLTANTAKQYTVENVAAKYLSSQGFSVKYDQENTYIGIGCSNGTKILYSVKQNKPLTQVQCVNEIPTTCVKWRPSSNSSKVLGITNAEGNFQYWHVPSMKKLFSIQEKQNSLHCCDFSKTGDHFATAGKDYNIRIYDQHTKSISTILRSAQWNQRGHSNRIFSIKFIDDNTLISGGWDSVVHLWDIRQAKSVKSFYGPHIAGDSIDVQDNNILIGCYAAKDQIQFWDLGKFQKIQAITWDGIDKEKVAYVYTACFNPLKKGMVLAGACGVNEVKIFSQEGSRHKSAITLFGLKHGCYSVDMSHRSNQFAFSTAHQAFYIYKYGIK